MVETSWEAEMGWVGMEMIGLDATERTPGQFQCREVVGVVGHYDCCVAGSCWILGRIAMGGPQVSGEKCKCHNRFSSIRRIERYPKRCSKHSSFVYFYINMCLDVLSTGNDENKRVYDDDWLVLYLFNIHKSIPFQSFVIQLESVRTRSKK